MLTIEYEQSLVETAVFLAVRRDASLECALHEAIDPLYEIPDEELRQREFAPVFRTMFTKLGFDQIMSGLLSERPLLGERVDRCVVREAARSSAQAAELHVQDHHNRKNDISKSNCNSNSDAHHEGANSDTVQGRNTLVIQICPQSFIEPDRFIPMMRRELLHVADMLDERFGYVRETFSGDPTLQNLKRDRYRVLWDIFVEGRLEREQNSDLSKKMQLERVFSRVFAIGDASTMGTDAAIFRRVIDAAMLTHRNFMAWANDPSQLLDATHLACCDA